MLRIRVLHKSRVFLIEENFDAKNVAIDACVYDSENHEHHRDMHVLIKS